MSKESYNIFLIYFFTIYKAYFWDRVRHKKLTVNMRARNAENENAKEFSDDLLKVGAGTFPKNDDGLIDIRSMATYTSTEDELINKIYPELNENVNKCEYFSDRAILSVLNDEVDRINTKIMEGIPSDFLKLESIDENMNDGDCIEYPVETLNSFKPSGFPDSSISIKLGVPVMIIKNMGIRIW